LPESEGQNLADCLICAIFARLRLYLNRSGGQFPSTSLRGSVVRGWRLGFRYIQPLSSEYGTYQGQILAFAFRQNSIKPFKLFSRHSEAVYKQLYNCTTIQTFVQLYTEVADEAVCSSTHANALHLPVGFCCWGLGFRYNCTEREIFIDNLLVRNHFIIVMIRWTGLAPWECEFPFPGRDEPA